MVRESSTLASQASAPLCLRMYTCDRESSPARSAAHRHHHTQQITLNIFLCVHANGTHCQTNTHVAQSTSVIHLNDVICGAGYSINHDTRDWHLLGVEYGRAARRSRVGVRSSNRKSKSESKSKSMSKSNMRSESTQGQATYTSSINHCLPRNVSAAEHAGGAVRDASDFERVMKQTCKNKLQQLHVRASS